MSGPLIFDIARGSQVDGPGLRTTVFMKGCPLRCLWCHNPESHRFRPDFGWDASACKECGCCLEVCPKHAVKPGSLPRIDPHACSHCGACVEACDYGALNRLGRPFEMEELLEVLLRDKVYYRVSGGGVTFSGGEPLAHMQWLHPLLEALSARNVHVAIQTCGYCAYSSFQALLPYVDLLFYDLKLINDDEHIRFTGRSNRPILENFQRLSKTQPQKLVPRIPLIPGYTATEENLTGLAAFLKKCGFRCCELLPYHGRGEAKWRILGRVPEGDLTEEPMTREQLHNWRSFISRILPDMSSPVH